MDRYVYYRVPVDQASLLQQRVQALQQRVQAQCGVRGELKRRPGEQDGRHTWMEVYRALTPEFEACLRACEQALDLAALIDGPRHVDDFLDPSEWA
jgi:hypothetical protein